MVYYCGVGKLCRAPLSALLSVRIVNEQAIAVVISQLTFEVNTPTGWLKVARADESGAERFYSEGNPPNNFTQATELRFDTLRTMLMNRAVGPKETVVGWVAIAYPPLNQTEILPEEWRITIADTLGHKSVVESEKVKLGRLWGIALYSSSRAARYISIHGEIYPRPAWLLERLRRRCDAKTQDCTEFLMLRSRSSDQLFVLKVLSLQQFQQGVAK